MAETLPGPGRPLSRRGAAAPTDAPRRTALLVLGGLLGAMYLFGFIAAPRSCQWGLDAWFMIGLGMLILCVVVPLRAPGARLVRSPLGSAALLGGACFLVWLLGLFTAGFQLLCRMF